MSTSFVAMVDGSFSVFTSRKDLEDFAKLYLQENPEGEIHFSLWNPATIKRQVRVEIVGLTPEPVSTSGKGRPKGVPMARDERGNLLKKDGTPALKMGRKPSNPAPSVEAASSEPTTVQDSGTVLVRKNGDALVTSEQHA